MDRRRAQLHERARRQGGLLTARDLRDIGYGRNQGARMAARGELRRLQPRVFAVASVPDSRPLRVRAVLLAAGPQAVLSHVTAGEILQLRLLPPRLVEQRIDLTVPRGHHPAVEGATVHRPLILSHDDVTESLDLRHTTVRRTLLDLSSVLHPTTYQRVVDAALSEGRVTCEELAAAAAYLGSFPGVRLVRRTLEAFDPRMRGTRSELERGFFRGLRAAGVDLPTADVEIRDADGRVRFLDFAYVPERLPIEIDSVRHHGSTLARAHDGARQNAIVLTGEWRAPLRFDEHDIRERMAAVASEVARALQLIRTSMEAQRTR